MAKKTKRKKKAPVEINHPYGLTAKQVTQIRSAVREVWSWSPERRKVINRCLGFDGFSFCEGKGCGKKCAKVFVDHIINVGDIDDGFLKRMFVSADKMQGLCDACHKIKTKAERDAKKKK